MMCAATRRPSPAAYNQSEATAENAKLTGIKAAYTITKTVPKIGDGIAKARMTCLHSVFKTGAKYVLRTGLRDSYR
jgi:hypothetical protein